MHVVSDDERRRIAERLRDEVGRGSSWPGMERLGLILGIEREPRTGWEGRILTRLADLMEPPYPDATASYKGWRAEVYDHNGALASPSNVAADLVRSHADGKVPSEPKVRCVAEVKVDGERLEKLVHDAVVELTGIDRDALLALTDEMDAYTECDDERCGKEMPPSTIHDFARRISEACGCS